MRSIGVWEESQGVVEREAQVRRGLRDGPHRHRQFLKLELIRAVPLPQQYDKNPRGRTAVVVAAYEGLELEVITAMPHDAAYIAAGFPLGLVS